MSNSPFNLDFLKEKTSIMKRWQILLINNVYVDNLVRHKGHT